MSTRANRRLLIFLVPALFSLAVAQEEGQTGPGPSRSATRRTSALTAADRKFINEAAEGGMAEVELGRLAQLKGTSDDVKKFGQKMVEDHRKANDKLKELAAAKRITLPEKPGVKQEATKDRLIKLWGAQFDEAYMTYMVRDHRLDVAAFRAESKSGNDGEVRTFATTTLPTVRDHLKDAQSIVPKVLQARSAMEPGKGAGR